MLWPLSFIYQLVELGSLFWGIAISVLDGVGPVDNRPIRWLPPLFKKNKQKKLMFEN